MTIAELEAALRSRYRPPEWAYLGQVRSATGFGNARTADAIAMNLWPSRGLVVHGFEFKVSRTDWLKELREPAKAEEIARYCDFWWLVVGDKAIVKPGELPATWGLMAPRGQSLVIAEKAEILQPAALDRPFVAAILRKAQEASPGEAALAAEFKRGCKVGTSEQKKLDEQQRYLESDDRELERLRNQIKDFKKASGVDIDSYNGGMIGRAVRMALEMESWVIRGRLKSIGIEAETIARRVREVLSDEDTGADGGTGDSDQGLPGL